MDDRLDSTATERQDGASVHPAGFCRGQGLIVVYGNAAFQRVFGAACVGMPAREGMVGLSREAFAVMDAVLHRTRPAARWVRLNGAEWRLTVAPRADVDTGETYGVAFHLRPRDETDGPANAGPAAANRKLPARSQDNRK
jgi:hypothetical protein